MRRERSKGDVCNYKTCHTSEKESRTEIAHAIAKKLDDELEDYPKERNSSVIDL